MFETEDLEEKVAEIDYDTRLLITEWVMKHIVEHAEEGGSYRYLIYDRLGFGPDAYGFLCSDGMTISNEFDLKIMPKLRQVAFDNKLDILKPLLYLCDEPGCYTHASCGFPVEGGYRTTCYSHMKEYNDRKNNTESPAV
jgi:hypothetical protein